MRSPLFEIIDAGMAWRQWSHMATTEIVMHYRRSIIGPFWISLNMIALIGSIGFVYAFVFKMPMESYIPYFATGMLAWNFISCFITTGMTTFTYHSGMIKNSNIPLAFFAFKLVAKQLVIFCHNLVVLVLIYVISPLNLNFHIFLIIPAIILYCIFGLSVSIIMGMICSRFRDVENLVTNFLQACFFLTPIFWPASNLNGSYIVRGNVFYHYVEIIRAPLLGTWPTATNWLVTSGFTLVLSGIAAVLYVRYRWRVVHTV